MLLLFTRPTQAKKKTGARIRRCCPPWESRRLQLASDNRHPWHRQDLGRHHGLNSLAPTCRSQDPNQPASCSRTHGETAGIANLPSSQVPASGGRHRHEFQVGDEVTISDVCSQGVEFAPRQATARCQLPPHASTIRRRSFHCRTLLEGSVT